MWINFIYVHKTVIRRLFLWQNHCFTYIAMFLLTLDHHRDGFVHSITTAKPYSETSFGFDKLNRP